MKSKNGRPLEIEAGVPGTPKISHLSIQEACNRFLAKRGLHNPGFRRSEWLYGRMSINQQQKAA
jgi:hypothetical protein